MDVASIKEALNFNNNTKFITPHTLGIVLRDFVKSDVVGNLTSLKTSNKSNIVAAVNEIVSNMGGISDIDSSSFGANGYVRWKNGFQIAWLTQQINAGGNLWSGTGIYYSDHSLGNWVKPFTNCYICVPYLNSATYWGSVSGAGDTSAGSLRCFRPNSSTATIWAGALAFGKWK